MPIMRTETALHHEYPDRDGSPVREKAQHEDLPGGPGAPRSDEVAMRKHDPKLLAHVRTLLCLACGSLTNPQIYPTEADHVTSRGAGGADTESNVWPLCRSHHRMRHQQGLGYMVDHYQLCRQWLIKASRTDVLDRIERFRGKRPLCDPGAS